MKYFSFLVAAMISLFCFDSIFSQAEARRHHKTYGKYKKYKKYKKYAHRSKRARRGRRIARRSKRSRRGRKRSRGRGGVVARVSIGGQRMNVYVNGKRRYSWRVSTGKSGYATPRGSYSPRSFQTMHYSRKYGGAPMPYSIFFRGGYAIHGTGAVSRLGRRASHGCIRLATGNAARLFSLMRRHGGRISIN